jgi:RNA-directed DNA polymerase
VLNYHLYIAPETKKYGHFQIPKRGGGKRDICAPIGPIKILQRKLNSILQNVYKTKPFAHGFLNKRSIITNARMHINKEFVLNIDLLDFFPSINFGRAYGMFKAKPYELPEKVAAVLAKLCCFNNQLPQGAPTSPIVSNMVCARLDEQLGKLAKKYNCIYTRYADDITFSTDQPDFPSALATAKTSSIPYKEVAEVGSELKTIIEKNGFSINPRKVWLQPSRSRQQVTGLTVNSFPNVSRKYTNQIRAMLHAWEKYGLNWAEKEFFKKHDKKHRRVIGPPGIFKKIVRGKLNFLKAVRSSINPQYLRLCKKLAEVDPDFAVIYERLERAAKPIILDDAVFIIETDTNQGTAFLLDGVGLVTCAHILGGETKKTFVYHHSNPDMHYETKITKQDTKLDIMILTFEGIGRFVYLHKGDSSNLQRGYPISVVGFPNYAPGNTVQVYSGEIAGQKKSCAGHKRFNVSAHIYKGNSGGPVLDVESRVIGIAVTGEDRPGLQPPKEEYGVIPIELLDVLLKT